LRQKNIWATVLAGGSRLWPLSRQHLPKQFLSLNGDKSLLQTTINRLSPVIDAKNILIVTQETHAKGEAHHALLPYQSLFEPVGRNTRASHRTGRLPDVGWLRPSWHSVKRFTAQTPPTSRGGLGWRWGFGSYAVQPIPIGLSHSQRFCMWGIHVITVTIYNIIFIM